MGLPRTSGWNRTGEPDKSLESPEANGATAAATSTHVAASGPMIDCREANIA